jgi:polysaccharide deacetylase 2 family uncharacterized protein YibQ
MTKKRKSHKDTFFSRKKLAITIFVFLVPIVLIFGTKYFEVFQSQEKKNQTEKSTEFLMDKMKKMLDEEKNRLAILPKVPNIEEKQKFQKLPPVTQEVQEKVQKNEEHFSEIHDYKQSLDTQETNKTEVITKKVYVPLGQPKLAIIIDDVAYEHQIRLIKKIPYKVTPSFFPPTQRHPDTVKLSKKFDFAMVHLPMQALSYGKPEPSTLNVGDSREVISARIQQIKEWFPQINYYNNHTGSKYTSDFDSMDKLISILKEEDITFIDSRTTAQTKAEEVFTKYNLKLLSRDIFLDNDIDKNAIKAQLKKAVNLAKKHGFSIAIGHPHVNTLEVLRESKNILKGVDVVYVKDL